MTPGDMRNDAAYRRAACLAADSPTFGQIAVAVGLQEASKWLAGHLTYFARMAGVPFDKMPDPATTAAVCSSLISNLPRMRGPWLWVFLLDLLAGRWGKKSYGRLDVADIGGDMRQFLAEELPAAQAAQKPPPPPAASAEVVVDVEAWMRGVVERGGVDTSGNRVSPECLAECRRMLNYFRTPKKARKWLK